MTDQPGKQRKRGGLQLQQELVLETTRILHGAVKVKLFVACRNNGSRSTGGGPRSGFHHIGTLQLPEGFWAKLAEVFRWAGKLPGWSVTVEPTRGRERAEVDDQQGGARKARLLQAAQARIREQERRAREAPQGGAGGAENDRSPYASRPKPTHDGRSEYQRWLDGSLRLTQPEPVGPDDEDW